MGDNFYCNYHSFDNVFQLCFTIWPQIHLSCIIVNKVRIFICYYDIWCTNICLFKAIIFADQIQFKKILILVSHLYLFC